MKRKEGFPKKLGDLVLSRSRVIVVVFLYITIVLTIGAYTFLSLIVEFLNRLGVTL